MPSFLKSLPFAAVAALSLASGLSAPSVASPEEKKGAAATDEPLACEGTEPINTACPITGDKVDPATAKFTTIYRARFIGFSTDAAKAEWEKWDVKKKNEFLAKYVKPGPVNDMCPIGKEPIDPKVATIEYAGSTIGFCCPSCASKFEAWETAKKDEYVKGYIDRPVANKTCLMTGEALDADSPNVVFLGTKVAFCCKGCARKWDLMTHAEKSEKVKAIASAAAPAPKQ